MSTAMPMACAAPAATKRLLWLWTMKRMNTSAAMPATTARKALTLGGCLRSHASAAATGLREPLISSPLPSERRRRSRSDKAKASPGFSLSGFRPARLCAFVPGGVGPRRSLWPSRTTGRVGVSVSISWH
jgi:hypothetical protein